MKVDKNEYERILERILNMPRERANFKKEWILERILWQDKTRANLKTKTDEDEELQLQLQLHKTLNFKSLLFESDLS